jgi:hypothetical protein
MFTIASFIPGPSGSLPVNTAANIAASIAYVSTIITFLKCVGLLWKKRLYSKRMQIFLLGYVSAMFLLATASLFQELAYFSSVIFPSSGSAAASSSSAEYKLFDVPIALPFTIWGADMFMVRSKNVLFVSRAYLFLVDMEMLHAVPRIIMASSPVNLSSLVVSRCGYNLYGLKLFPFP